MKKLNQVLALLGLLRDIRTELTLIRQLLEQQGYCPHGSTGVCMFCVNQTLESTINFEMRKIR